MPETFYSGDEIDFMTDEFGVTVTIGAVTAKAIVDRSSREVLAVLGLSSLWGRVIEVKFRTGKFPAVAVEGVITVEGTAYSVVKLIQTDDGALSHAFAAVEV